MSRRGKQALVSGNRMGNTKSKFQENHKLSKRDLKVLHLIWKSKCILETILVHEVHQKYPKYAFKDIEYSVELLKIKFIIKPVESEVGTCLMITRKMESEVNELFLQSQLRSEMKKREDKTNGFTMSGSTYEGGSLNGNVEQRKVGPSTKSRPDEAGRSSDSFHSVA